MFKYEISSRNPTTDKGNVCLKLKKSQPGKLGFSIVYLLVTEEQAQELEDGADITDPITRGKTPLAKRR
mgnify:CR=1 FL=1